jgi:ABC-2 type transport system ATP-binding protein
VLELDRVTKAFEGVVAVDGLSLRVPEGTILGFLGPNGAGKTTTMRLVLDILRPEAGRITWRGASITDAVRRRFGYLPEERGLYQKMKVGDQLLFFARLYGMERREAERAIDAWLERFDISGRRQSRVEELSKGNQQKVQVLAALVHGPDLALLDEPFSGLDPVNTEHLTAALLELRDAGKTVVFSSHRLEQVEDLCEEVAIIADGSLRLAGNVDAIRDAATRRVINLRVAGGAEPDVHGLPLESLDSGRGHRRYALRPGVDSQSILAALVQRATPVELFALERPSLQEVFLEVTADDRVSSPGTLLQPVVSEQHGAA